MAEESLTNKLLLDLIEATRQQTAAMGTVTERLDNTITLLKNHAEEDAAVHEKHSDAIAAHDKLWIDLKARVATWALVFSGVGAILMLAAKEAVAFVVNSFTGHP